VGDEVSPFKVSVAQAELDDLRERLRYTRWPDAETVADWSQGVPLTYLRRVCTYWQEQYDWRAAERRLNAVPQFRTEIDGLGIHFLHARSPHPEALPLLLTHGWPGSVLEFLDVLGPLTRPTEFGGEPADAFTVVCPSLPGYGFSDHPTQPGWGVERIADAWAELMERLGHERFGAQGGDWGTTISTTLAQRHPERLAGIHLTPPLAAPDPATTDDLTDAEREALAALEHARHWEDGYSGQQATRPQTLGYALNDSPVGLCAWILEKFAAWTDSDGDPEKALPLDVMLDDITLYWLTGTATSSARLYWESIRDVQRLFTEGSPDVVTVPTGGTVFPREVPRISRRWAERRFTDLRFWSEPERGGHFGVLEQPQRWVADVRAFFRLVR
jgi:epoxide hydrolase